MKSNQNIGYVTENYRAGRNLRSTLICRLTYNKKRKQFSNGLSVNPSNWNSKQQLVEPPEPDLKYINTQLSLIKNILNQAFLFLQVQVASFTVHDIYLKYKGKTTSKEKGVIEAYKEYCNRISKLVGKDIQEVTYNKYLESGRHLQDFIKHKFKASDTLIRPLKPLFWRIMCFLKTDKSMAQSTLNKAIQRFRRVVKYAISQEYLGKDPFILHRPKSVKKPIVFLDKKELKVLESKVFEIDRLNRVKDLFVFCCYTGLGFTEMVNLRKDQIIPDGEGNI